MFVVHLWSRLLTPRTCLKIANLIKSPEKAMWGELVLDFVLPILSWSKGEGLFRRWKRKGNDFFAKKTEGKGLFPQKKTKGIWLFWRRKRTKTIVHSGKQQNSSFCHFAEQGSRLFWDLSRSLIFTGHIVNIRSHTKYLIRDQRLFRMVFSTGPYRVFNQLDTGPCTI